jgi:hypothetical protein
MMLLIAGGLICCFPSSSTEAGIPHAIDAAIGQRMSPLSKPVCVTPEANAYHDRIAAELASRQATLRIFTDLIHLTRNEALLRDHRITAKELEAARSQLAADRAKQHSAELR